MASNRTGGPERVIDAVEERAGEPGLDVERLVPMAKRARIVRSYTRLAGFTKKQLAAAGARG